MLTRRDRPRPSGTDPAHRGQTPPTGVRPRCTLWVLAVALVATLRHVTVLADFYVLHIYPAVSCVLSFIARIVPFSLEEITVLSFVAAFFIIIVRAAKKHEGFWRWLIKELKLAAVIYMWFYLGWGLCYSRSSLLERTGTQRAQFDAETFTDFLYSYSATLDSLYLISNIETDAKAIESGMKDFYASVPEQYGLAKPRRWQHAKRPLLNWMYSGSGVLGFMGPFFAESQLNKDLLPEEYPFTLMHEYSHLLGTAVESEANWWAFQACSAHPSPFVQYSAYFSILPYVWSNAHGLLETDAFTEWSATVNPSVIEQYQASRDYWQAKRFTPLDKAQSFIYNLFLKGNGIPTGMQNYSEVIGLLMTLPEL